MKIRARILILTLFLAAGIADADLLVLKDGDVLSGTVVRIRQHILVFRTSLAGQLTAPLDTVETISTDQLLLLTLDDGTLFTGRLKPAGGVNQVQLLEGGDPVRVDLTQIIEAEVIPKNDAVADSRVDKPDTKLVTELELGAMGRTGNGDGVAPYGGLTLDREGNRTRLHARGLATAGNEDWLRGEVHLDGNDPGWSPYGRLDLDSDEARALDLRTDIALGIRYQHQWDSGGTGEFLGGIALTHENAGAAGGNGTGTHVNFQLGLRYAQDLFAEGQFSSTLLVLPSLSDLDAVRLRSDSSVSYSPTRTLRLRLNVLLDYDSDPLHGDLERFDAGVGAGLSVRF